MQTKTDAGNHDGFSICYTRVGENKKYKARNSKYVRHILKYLRRIFEETFSGHKL